MLQQSSDSCYFRVDYVFRRQRYVIFQLKHTARLRAALSQLHCPCELLAGEFSHAIRPVSRISAPDSSALAQCNRLIEVIVPEEYAKLSCILPSNSWPAATSTANQNNTVPGHPRACSRRFKSHSIIPGSKTDRKPPFRRLTGVLINTEASGNRPIPKPRLNKNTNNNNGTNSAKNDDCDVTSLRRCTEKRHPSGLICETHHCLNHGGLPDSKRSSPGTNDIEEQEFDRHFMTGQKSPNIHSLFWGSTGHNTSVQYSHKNKNKNSPVYEPNALPRDSSQVTRSSGQYNRMSGTSLSLSVPAVQLDRGQTTSRDVSVIPEENSTLPCSCTSSQQPCLSVMFNDKVDGQNPHGTHGPIHRTKMFQVGKRQRMATFDNPARKQSKEGRSEAVNTEGDYSPDRCDWKLSNVLGPSGRELESSGCMDPKHALVPGNSTQVQENLPGPKSPYLKSSERTNSRAVALLPEMSPKRVIRISEVKRGNSKEISLGGTFASGRAGHDIATQLVAARTDLVQLDAVHEAGKHAPDEETIDGTQMLTQDPYLLMVSLEERGNPSERPTERAFGPEVLRVNEPQLRRAHIDRTTSIATQVLPTYRARSLGVQTAREIETGRKTASRCGTPSVSEGSVRNTLMKQSRQTRVKTASSQTRRSKPKSLQTWDTSRAVSSAERSTQTQCSSFCATDSRTTPTSIVANAYLTSPDDDLQTNLNPAVIPQYVQRTDSWSYWPRTAIRPPETRAHFSDSWVLVGSNRLDGSGNTDLKNSRVERSSDLIRMLVAPSGESTYSSLLGSEEYSNKPGLVLADDVTFRNLSPLEKYKAQTRTSESTLEKRQSHFSSWSTQSESLHVCSTESLTDIIKSTCLGKMLLQAAVIVNPLKKVHSDLSGTPKVAERPTEPKFIYTSARVHEPTEVMIRETVHQPVNYENNAADIEDSNVRVSTTEKIPMKKLYSDASAQTGADQQGKEEIRKSRDSLLYASPTKQTLREKLSRPTKTYVVRRNSTERKDRLRSVLAQSGRRSVPTRRPCTAKTIKQERSEARKSAPRRLSFVSKLFPSLQREPPSIMATQVSSDPYNSRGSKAYTLEQDGDQSHSKPFQRDRARPSDRLTTTNASPYHNSLLTGPKHMHPTVIISPPNSHSHFHGSALKSCNKTENIGGLDKEQFQELMEMVENYFSVANPSKEHVQICNPKNTRKVSPDHRKSDKMFRRYHSKSGERGNVHKNENPAFSPQVRLMVAHPSGYVPSRETGGRRPTEVNENEAEIGEREKLKDRNTQGIGEYTMTPDKDKHSLGKLPLADKELLISRTHIPSDHCLTEVSGLEDTESSELYSVDQRIEEALHGTLDRILFESADKLASVIPTGQESRAIKLISRLEFVGNEQPHKVKNERKSPEVIRSYEVVHNLKPAARLKWNVEEGVPLISKSPFFVGPAGRYGQFYTEHMPKASAGEKTLWCCTPWRK
ncbi:hypothetical protein CRM22_004265 [Opisthorchis felineus]|uniref:Uncharacterized protein n=1 Tax=Opisthorchis felineus TaxID=147828 RepID=A0A4V6RH23_OPIFE|nr:hypothetical protein CRM22_004265 [Opisthorchis felineus]